jgi:hypothetical protein
MFFIVADCIRYEDGVEFMVFKTRTSMLLSFIPFFFMWGALKGFIKHLKRLK